MLLENYKAPYRSKGAYRPRTPIIQTGQTLSIRVAYMDHRHNSLFHAPTLNEVNRSLMNLHSRWFANQLCSTFTVRASWFANQLCVTFAVRSSWFANQL